MALNKPVLQVVGFQDSGKTTLALKIIEAMTNENVRVGTIKHHGHGGVPAAIDTGKDSDKHRLAGAVVTGVEGDGVLQLHANNRSEWSLEELLYLYKLLPLDLILVEGFKREAYPKIVLIRSEEDEQLISELEQIILVITWSRTTKVYAGIPCFHIEEEYKYIPWIVSYLKGRI